MTPVGGEMISCSVVKTQPFLIMEMVFASREGGERVIETFNNKTVSTTSHGTCFVEFALTNAGRRSRHQNLPQDRFRLPTTYRSSRYQKRRTSRGWQTWFL